MFNKVDLSGLIIRILLLKLKVGMKIRDLKFNLYEYVDFNDVIVLILFYYVYSYKILYKSNKIV